MYQMQNKIVSAMYFLKTIVKEYHHKLVRYHFFFRGSYKIKFVFLHYIRRDMSVVSALVFLKTIVKGVSSFTMHTNVKK